jgi:hypothetical protein
MAAFNIYLISEAYPVDLLQPAEARGVDRP